MRYDLDTSLTTLANKYSTNNLVDFINAGLDQNIPGLFEAGLRKQVTRAGVWIFESYFVSLLDGGKRSGIMDRKTRLYYLKRFVIFRKRLSSRFRKSLWDWNAIIGKIQSIRDLEFCIKNGTSVSYALDFFRFKNKLDFVSRLEIHNSRPQTIKKI